jgi:hypothetical protein
MEHKIARKPLGKSSLGLAGRQCGTIVPNHGACLDEVLSEKCSRKDPHKQSTLFDPRSLSVCDFAVAEISEALFA